MTVETDPPPVCTGSGTCPPSLQGKAYMSTLDGMAQCGICLQVVRVAWSPLGPSLVVHPYRAVGNALVIEELRGQLVAVTAERDKLKSEAKTEIKRRLEGHGLCAVEERDAAVRGNERLRTALTDLLHSNWIECHPGERAFKAMISATNMERYRAALSPSAHEPAGAGFVPWPLDQPRRYNGSGQPCDMWTGPCQCGATHSGGK